jgi:tight adherence protein B
MFEATIVAICIGLAVLSLFVAMPRFLPQRDPLEERLREYGLSDYVKMGRNKEGEKKRQRFALMGRIAHGFGLDKRLSNMLAAADVPLTVGECAFAMLALGTAGFVFGMWRVHPLVGLALGAAGGLAPVLYLKFKQGRRQKAFVDQLPDVLTLLVGSMRAGYGLGQAFDLVAREVADPAAKEFGRVVRATNLGLPMQHALEAMADRIKSDDLDLVVTAINIQYEMGGNLSAVLETISDTIRERIKVLRDVRSLTAQQRMTGYILALLPVGLAGILSVMQPGYFDPFFEPGWPRFLPIGAAVMMGIGFFLIQKIVDIKV